MSKVPTLSVDNVVVEFAKPRSLADVITGRQQREIGRASCRERV